MFSKLKNFFKKKNPVSKFPPQVAGRSTRPIYTPTASTTQTNYTDDSADFLSGYVAATVINDLLESTSKVSEPVEQSTPREKSTWGSDYGSSKSESYDPWSSSSSSSDSWSSSSPSDSWSSSDSSSSSDW